MYRPAFPCALRVRLSHPFLLLAFVVVGLALASITANAQNKEYGKSTNIAASGFAESGAVRDLPKASSPVRSGPARDEEINPENREIIRHVDPKVAPSADKALYTKPKAIRNAAVQPKALPTPAVSFEGISQADTIAADPNQGFLPPDTNGAVGPNHFVQSVNSSFRVWDKAGNPLTATTSLATLFSPLGCGTGIDGDPIVLYDQLADRWIISEFCTVANPNNHQLIAISKTSDPTGSYYLYDFMMPNNKFNDYPHLSVWSDAYYMTDNQFNQAGTAFQQAGAFAFNRAKMLAGDPTAGLVYFDTAVLFPPGVGINGTDGIGGMLPANVDGLVAPPTGAPCPFAYVQSGEFGDPADQLRIFEFHVDFVTPANSTFTERTGSPLAVAAFDPVTVPNSRNVVPQPAPSAATSYLDAINDRLMFRLAYRNFGASESLVLNHTVNAAVNPSYRAGVRFYQLNRATPSAAFAIAEQQTFAGAAGDTASRWMGSAAMNFQGDIAVGYSVSSTTVFPSIRYAAKLGTDPAGSGLAQGEQTLIAGGGAQTSTSGRWGDYSDMTVDPSDDCSFWFTEEYYAASSASSWRTRIARIVVGTAAVSPRGTISGTVTNCQTGLPVANAVIQITGGFIRTTAADGTYSATVAPGTYSATVTAPSFGPATSGSLLVSNGGTATFSVCLAGVPILTADTSAVTADSCNSNGIIDPNEIITVNLGIKNTGSANTSNLVATLQTTGGVTSPSAPQTYGVVTAGGSTVSKSFTFTSGNVACGSSIIATLALQDGATNLGTITFTFQTGTAGAPATATYSSGNSAVAIPDQGSVDVPITINDVGSISDVNVSVRLNHTFDSDLVISLIGPDNTSVILVNKRGSSGQNFGTGNNDCSGTPTLFDDSAATSIAVGTAPFTGSFKPESVLSAFNGKSITGTWKLHFSDTAAVDTGTVGCATLQITRQQFVCCGVSGTPAIASGGSAVVTAENFTPANSAPDPGEYVTVSLPVINTGTANTANLIGTLQASGGVTNPSGPQTYGVVVAGGPTAAKSFSFIATGACGSNITLTLALQDGVTNLGSVTYSLRLGTISNVSQTFSNGTAITIPATGTGATTGAPATPYPSNITVAGAPVSPSKITVTLKNISHTFPSDVDVLLVGPTGQKFIVLSDAIGGTDWTGQTYTFDDNAAAILSNAGTPPASGSFRPTNYGTGDVFPVPAPAAPYLSPATAGANTLASTFAGLNPNGTWSLYVVDDAGTDIGSFAGGWDLTITSSTNVCIANQAPSIVNGPPPSPVIVGTPYSFKFIASGNPAPSFSESGALPPGLGLSAGGVLSGTATSGGTGSFPNIVVTATNGVASDATQTFGLSTATRTANYLAGFGLTGSDAVFTFDYDGDGLANLLEYGLGLDPTIAGLNGLPVVTLKDYSGTQYLSMTFHRSSLATDLTYIVQGSADLSNWTDLGTSAAGATTGGPGFIAPETGSAPTFTVEVRDTVPYDPNAMAKRFIRLKITSP